MAQSGGPTAVINASVAGIIQEAGHYECVEEIYGGLHGILGILNEDLIDLNEEKNFTIEALKCTPGAALGTCRYKIDFKKNPDQAALDMKRIFEVFQAHNIRYFFYVGGNDSQDTAHKIHLQAQQIGYDMRVVGVPKTIDNDLPHTDHCPGYGSVVKYNAATVMEIAADVGSMAIDGGSCVVIEVMGRHAGWIAAGTVLAKRRPEDAPHIILLPEIAFDEPVFLAKVRQIIAANDFCMVVVGEGLKNNEGRPIAADTSRLDAFGHPVLSGMGEYIEDLVKERLGIKSRSVKLGYAQRCAGHFASATDMKEAVACGHAAVRAAMNGKSGHMVKIVRTQNDPYTWTTDVQPLAEIANVEHVIPREWIDAEGFMPNEQFVQYVAPLISGEMEIALDGGLPKLTRLARIPVEKKLPPRGGDPQPGA